MIRRQFLALLPAMAAAPVLAHTPYRQWKVMRERFLLVHSTRTDEASDRIAEQLVASLQAVLPEAQARVARARHEQRLASLLTTGQAMLAVMRPQDAQALYRRSEPFAGYEGAKLRSLLEVGDHLLVTVADFPRHHGWLLAAALVENPGAVQVRLPSADTAVPPLHEGAAAYGRGEPLDSGP
jgi:hypothetical protein